MAGDILGETGIEVVADMTSFAAQLAAGVQEGIDAAAAEMDAGMRVAGEEAGTSAAEGLADTAPSWGEVFVSIAQLAASTLSENLAAASAAAGVEGASALAQGFSSAAGSLSDVFSGIADSLGATVDEEMTAAGVTAGQSFGAGLDSTAAETGASFGELLGGSLSATSDVVSGFGAKIGEVFGAATGIAKVGMAGLTAGVIDFGLKGSSALQNATNSFANMTGSAQTATTIVNNLENFAKTTPFQFTELQPAAQRFLAMGSAVGVTSTNLDGYVKSLSDAVTYTGGSANNINRMALALSEVASKGTLTQQSVTQLARDLPGLNTVTALANGLGETQAQVQQQIHDGSISASVGINAYIQGLEMIPGVSKAATVASQTLSGSFSTLKDSLRLALSQGFLPVIPEITASIQGLAPALSASFAAVSPALGGALAQLIKSMAPIAQGMFAVIAPIAQAFTGLMASITPVLGPLGSAIGAVLAPLVPLGQEAGQIAAALLTALIPAIKALEPAFAALMPIFPPLIAGFTQILAVLGPAFTQFIMALTPSIVPLTTALIQLTLALVPLAVQFAQVVAAITPFLAALVNAGVVDALAPLITAIAAGLKIMGPALGPLLDMWIAWATYTKAAAIATGLFEAVMASDVVVDAWIAWTAAMEASAAAGGLLDGVMIALDAALDANPIMLIVLALAALVGGIYEAYQHSATFRQIVQDVWDVIKGAATYISTEAVAAWHDLDGAINDTIGFFENLYKSASDIVTGVVAFFGRLPSDIGSALDAFGTTVVDFFKSIPGLLLDALAAIPTLLADLFDLMFKSALAVIVTAVNLIGDAIGLVVIGIYDALVAIPHLLSDLFTTMWEAGVFVVNTYIAAVVFIFTQLPGMILNGIASLGDLLGNFFTNLWHSTVSTVDQWTSDIIGFFTRLPGDIYNAVIGLSATLDNFFINLFHSAESTVSQGIADIVTWFSKLPGEIGSLAVSMAQAGENLINSLLKGMGNFAVGAGDFGKSIVNDIIGFLNTHVIESINHALGDIDILGYHPTGSDLLPTIPPLLANGTITTGAQLAIIGEAGTEVLIPMTNPARAVQLAQQSGLIDLLSKAGVLGGKGGPVTVVNAPVTVTSPATDPRIVAVQTVAAMTRLIARPAAA